MNKKRKNSFRSAVRLGAVIVLLLLLFSFVSCEKKTKNVSWFDADGTLISTQATSEDFDPTSRELPKDTNQWHYTEWVVTESGDVVVCTARREEKINLVWQDADGTVLHESFAIEGEEYPEYDLPEDTERWKYLDWEKEPTEGGYLYKASKEPNKEFFSGNVFQIVVKDKKGQLIGSGSGFVFHRDGWFVTNNHVMEKAYAATAFFDVKDTENGGKYTQLKILGGVYHSEKKDIFIGKLSGYKRLEEYYQEIDFTEQYEQGEDCYSVGYPNSSTEIEINSGTITEEYSDLYSKLDGIYYILSDSYIAPGSSGGILVNGNFEVVGITSIGFYSDDEKMNYVSGGSIPYTIFKKQTASVKESSLKPLAEIY